MVLTQLTVGGTVVPDLLITPGPDLDPAEPVTDWVAIPGGVDVDVTGLLTGGVPTFGHTTLKLACVLMTGETLWEALRRLTAAWHGQRLDIGFAERPGWHLTGRCTLDGWSWPGKRGPVRFTLTLDAEPYWWKDTPTTVAVAAAASPGTAFTLPPTGYTVMPVVTVTGSTVTLVQGTLQHALTPGTWPWVDGLLLRANAAPVTGRVVGATSATATFTWREGRVG